MDEKVREVKNMPRVRDQHPLAVIRQRIPKPLPPFEASMFCQHEQTIPTKK
ncbi:MAG: hypothetical protein ACI8P0_005764 [Planctomycetaceae bacterium]